MPLIDRKRLMDDLVECFGWKNATNGFVRGGYAARQVVYKQPIIDAVCVVRCKDCKHWGYEKRCNMLSSSKYTLTMDGNAFCSFGERKE